MQFLLLAKKVHTGHYACNLTTLMLSRYLPCAGDRTISADPAYHCSRWSITETSCQLITYIHLGKWEAIKSVKSYIEPRLWTKWLINIFPEVRASDPDGQESGDLECLLDKVARGFDLLLTTAGGMYSNQSTIDSSLNCIAKENQRQLMVLTQAHVNSANTMDPLFIWHQCTYRAQFRSCPWVVERAQEGFNGSPGTQVQRWRDPSEDWICM